MIDGLDEFEPSESNYSDLLDAVMGLQSGSNTKLCVSSRPETTFTKRLADSPSISLQELNFRDVKKYVAGKLETPGIAQKDLSYKVTIRAEGIFLWAVLVCQFIVTGRQEEEDEETLTRRLSIVPSGLKNLFNSMFSKIDECIAKTYHYTLLCSG